MSPKDEGTGEWNITLNRYQRDNLLHLLRCCGYPAGNEDTAPPFTIANTGDWLGEIHNLLAPGPTPEPNVNLRKALNNEAQVVRIENYSLSYCPYPAGIAGHVGGTHGCPACDKLDQEKP